MCRKQWQSLYISLGLEAWKKHGWHGRSKESARNNGIRSVMIPSRAHRRRWSLRQRPKKLCDRVHVVCDGPRFYRPSAGISPIFLARGGAIEWRQHGTASANCWLPGPKHVPYVMLPVGRLSAVHSRLSRSENQGAEVSAIDNNGKNIRRIDGSQGFFVPTRRNGEGIKLVSLPSRDPSSVAFWTCFKMQLSYLIDFYATKVLNKKCTAEGPANENELTFDRELKSNHDESNVRKIYK